MEYVLLTVLKYISNIRINVVVFLDSTFIDGSVLDTNPRLGCPNLILNFVETRFEIYFLLRVYLFSVFSI